MAVRCEDVGWKRVPAQQPHCLNNKKKPTLLVHRLVVERGPPPSVHVCWQLWEMKTDGGQRAERGCWKRRR